MKYLKKFDKHSDYEEYAESLIYAPMVSICEVEEDMHIDKTFEIKEKCLKFTAVSSSATLGYTYNGRNKPNIYKITNGEWKPWDGTSVSFYRGESIYVKGDNPDGLGIDDNAEIYFRFIGTGQYACSGNIMRLLGENIENIPCSYCFANLFNGCASLTTAPELPATTLVNYCYYYMFYGCTNLKSITMLATDISANYCLSNWVNGVASTGTFKCASGMSNVIPIGINGIPSGWTVTT